MDVPEASTEAFVKSREVAYIDVSTEACPRQLPSNRSFCGLPWE